MSRLGQIGESLRTVLITVIVLSAMALVLLGASLRILDGHPIVVGVDHPRDGYQWLVPPWTPEPVQIVMPAHHYHVQEI